MLLSSYLPKSAIFFPESVKNLRWQPDLRALKKMASSECKQLFNEKF